METVKVIRLCDVLYITNIDDLNKQLIERGLSAEDIISIAPSLTQGGYTYEVYVKDRKAIVSPTLEDENLWTLINYLD